MSKIRMLLSILAVALIVTACGGGGPGPTPTPTPNGGSGTASQYFTKTAVGNRWESQVTTVFTPTGQAATTSTSMVTITITASTATSVTYSLSLTSNGVTYPSTTQTSQIGTTGTWYPDLTLIDLPATFSVGTTWVITPANQSTGQGAMSAKIAAFNVTRTVPAGTFTDCLQVDTTGTSTIGGVITTYNGSTYVSAKAGGVVDFSSSNSSSYGTVTGTSQLQRYTAN